AVPGYNTSQELAQLLEVGPRFRPDLVVVGFYENDLIDNRPVQPAGVMKHAAFQAISVARRHVYSFELYKRAALSLAWKVSASDEYRRRLEHLGTEESLLARAADATTLEEQQLTPFERRSDEWVRLANCVYGMKPNPEIVPALQRDPGYGAWMDAVRGFQRLNRDGAYRIVFFLNVAPPVCPDGGSDMFYAGGTSALNAFYLSMMDGGTPAVSTYEAFLHVRPSQMPHASAHAIGNTNSLKAEVLLDYLRQH